MIGDTHNEYLKHIKIGTTNLLLERPKMVETILPSMYQNESDVSDGVESDVDSQDKNLMDQAFVHQAANGTESYSPSNCSSEL